MTTNRFLHRQEQRSTQIVFLSRRRNKHDFTDKSSGFISQAKSAASSCSDTDTCATLNIGTSVLFVQSQLRSKQVQSHGINTVNVSGKHKYTHHSSIHQWTCFQTMHALLSFVRCRLSWKQLLVFLRGVNIQSLRSSHTRGEFHTSTLTHVKIYTLVENGCMYVKGAKTLLCSRCTALA